MKLKLLVMLMIIGIISSCKQEETSSIELDKSEIVVVSGIISLENDFPMPDGSELLLVVNNSEYHDGANPSGEQIYYTPIGTDGSYSYDLPVKKRVNTSETTTVKMILSPITLTNEFEYGGTADTKNFIITFFDKEKTQDATFRILNSAKINGSVRNSDGSDLPANITITYTSSNGNEYTENYNANGGSYLSYSLDIIEPGTIDYNNLKISPVEYTDSATGFTYQAQPSSGSRDFTYVRI